MTRLRRADCSGPGFARRRRGRGFEYLDETGARVDAETVEWIHALASPPAWENVWICPLPNGHIHHIDNTVSFTDRMPYATGIDGVYAGSAGCFPAGSVIGAAGHNAAMRILRDLGR